MKFIYLSGLFLLALAFWLSPSSNTGVTSTSVDTKTEQTDSNAIRIWPVGDSITESFGYRVPLWNLLTRDGYNFTYVGSRTEEHPEYPALKHDGHGGFYIGHIAEHIEEWVKNAQPDIVLLMIGTNDVAWWTVRDGEQTAAELDEVVGMILEYTPEHTHLLVASIPPQSSKIVEPNGIDRAELTRNYNASMQLRMQQRTARGEPVTWVDIHSALTPGHLSDGIHPNSEGYDIIAQSWYEALVEVLPEP